MLVVGGGAGGLENLCVLAASGHRVTLWDSSEELGGALRYAGRAHPLLERYRGWLIGQVERAGVTIVLGRRADVVSVREIGADEVVVATGARFEKPDVFGADLADVQSGPRDR